MEISKSGISSCTIMRLKVIEWAERERIDGRIRLGLLVIIIEMKLVLWDQLLL